jgi:hypothetical protein
LIFENTSCNSEAHVLKEEAFTSAEAYATAHRIYSRSGLSNDGELRRVIFVATIAWNASSCFCEDSLAAEEM